MKKYLFMVAALATMLIGFNSCEGLKGNNSSNGEDKDGPDNPTGKLLTPEETKQEIMNIANGLIGKFNTADQKEALQLMDDMIEKYEQYNFKVVADEYVNRYDELFRVPRYMTAVLKGESPVPAMDHAYTFSFAEESVIWEADDANRTWVNKGPAPDNCIILRAKDRNGNWCEAKFRPEGPNKTYTYSFEKTHWEYQREYMPAYNIVEGYGSIYIDDVRYDAYFSEGNWYYYDEFGATIYVEPTDLAYFNVYDYNYNSYYSYDPDTESYYREDYSTGYEVSDGMFTVTGVLPEQIHFTFTHGNSQIASADIKQELLKNDHATINLEVAVTTLRWTADIDIRSTNGSVGFAFYYGDESLLSALINLPKYKLFGKEDSQTYEEWIEQYAEHYEELISEIGSADAVVDVLGMAQGKVNITNGGKAYSDIMNLMRQVNMYSQDGAQQYCNAINGAQTNSLYIGNRKQAEVRLTVMGDGEYYEPVPVLYFVSDQSSYAFAEYFAREPFTDLQKSIENLANTYIRMSSWLTDEVGEVRF